MRKLRSDTENIRDTRIAYTFLLSLAVLCLILGIIATNLGSRLHANELADSYMSLTLCSDALREWDDAASDEARYAAAIRFGNAAARLPSEVKLEPLLSLADKMRSGDGAASEVRAFADTFALLATLDYADNAEARSIIAETIDGVHSALTEKLDEDPPEAAGELLPEVVAYSQKVAQKGIEAIFGGNAGSLSPILAESGDVFVAENDNLRMTFSAADGSLESFVYIRLGDAPSTVRSRSERLSAALDFFNLNRRRGKGTDASIAGELCGFMLADITAGEETYRAAVDKYGRVWSLMKVKR
ncbi:MAG: hypothetical protein IJ428_00215 [Clostridia bacterium]|nr:hypothetical protein [Clostridia bacterium]